ncbi:MAG: DNA polymerase III subunit chi [Syntrophotalea acetylenica]|jgi:DNA polymerase-3 subunit chi|uniref:DNA polymerase III subunit chi n=1 Tax=Syntrophotalea acetylenica TaxID=29542 RepID=A0A1L3GJ34_SYNAC|nr:DNA polymerase III subunit chi [Syntrophotalea acetylenica]APG25895.1 DNA polymerase III subunit chi [Syntrophotalea acetylenica]APG43968.1 DNA polymerase III subunit chi [Syntrophotalea acetylenica]MDD4456976.1 DNA polymerase III subunit chi [Syntrophotalea acetylenica]MDY0262744.1 DNA polymerase III subunit chi [Syntrophotalea acetylenica]
MTRVEFVKILRPEKARHICELVEGFYSLGKRVLVMVCDANQGVTLDRFMWTWKKGSFIPHVYDNGAVDCLDEPVIITVEERNPNGAKILIMCRGCSQQFVRQFDLAIDFAEAYDPQLLQSARRRFAAFREAGFEVAMR